MTDNLNSFQIFESNSSASEVLTNYEVQDRERNYSRKIGNERVSHIVDELDLLEYKKFVIAPLYNDRSLHLKQSHSTNFVKKNIEKSDFIAKRLSAGFGDNGESLQFSIEELDSKNLVDVEDRFYKKAERYKSKLNQLKAKLAIEEVEGCTFKPKTNLKSNPKFKISEINKKNDDIVMRKRKKLELAIEKAKKEEIEKFEQDPDLTLRPKLCEKSKEILAHKPYSSTPAYQRLYQLNKTQIKNSQTNDAPKEEENETENVFFKPQINKKSQNMKRDQPTCIMLYQQASHKKSNSETPKANPKLFSENSEKILINKFCKEFNEKIEIYDGKPINYSEFSQILHDLGFIDQENSSDTQVSLDLFNLFQKPPDSADTLELDSLFTGLLAVQGLINPSNNEIFALSDFNSAIKTFEHLYINKKTHDLDKKPSKTKYKDSNCTFNPEIMQNSSVLAEKWRTAHRSAVKIEDMLAEENKNKQDNIQKLKEKVLQEEVKECTFAPKTELIPDIYEKTENEYTRLMSSCSSKTFHKGIALHDYYSVQKTKLEANIKTIKDDLDTKALQECTFTPQIKSSKGGNIESFLERMKERNLKKEVKNDGEGYFKFGKVKKFKSLSEFESIEAKGKGEKTDKRKEKGRNKG